ncbi:hypothetical protein BLNAU_10295 [Blattamonas nauphoetae]|uniref:Right handed beta helix domain-containing protein n=1 Tax=Blattamonas nauphoetae TaxID=2049346 RepID=A0ABQ9XTJ9_9EUKA|nr:hypothetical protein BLNAU_10295 [Blattamonas nauphoetae]
MNLPTLILIRLYFIKATFMERRVLPLSLQMAFPPDTEAFRISGNERTYVTEVNLDHGTYHSNAYLMDTVSLSLHGSDTTICRTSSLAKTETMDDQNSENNEYTNENSNPFIFLFMNSTISMSHLSLDCGWRGTSVGRISSSKLTIDNCPIISNPESSPFAINNGLDGIGSSIFFVDCSHESFDKTSLLALVSLIQSQMTNPRHTDNSQEASSTLVSCSGLSLCNTDLSFGSGPLVGFLSSTEQETAFWNNLETVLIGSRLVNMTSGEGKGALEGWSGSQKIFDSSVAQSTNHLCGTTCIDMNLGGSLLCSNTSFSHCHSSLEPEFVYARTYTLQHKTGTEQLIFDSIGSTVITIRRCTFVSMTSSNGAAIFQDKSPCKLAVSECSFSKCQTTEIGGAVFFNQSYDQRNPIAISSSLFVECSARRGGALYSYDASTCTITDSVFHDLTVSEDGGALYIYMVDVFSLSNCAFERCSAGDSSTSEAGGIYLASAPSLTMNAALFRECSAWIGTDISWNKTRPASELGGNVTNCDSTSERPNAYIYPS